ncbi:SCP domain-containing protein, partial [Trichostrongylus colubriformis]
MHNNFRALVATGRARNGFYPAEYAPPTGLMYRLKYDCWAEAYAHAHVRSCSGQASQASSRPGWKENIHVLQTTATDDLGAIQSAIAKWQSELALTGVPSNMVFTQEMRTPRFRIGRKMTK